MYKRTTMTKSRSALTSVATMALLSSASASRRVAMPPPMSKSDIPDAGGEWMSLEEGLEFQGDARLLHEEQQQTASGPYDRIFVDGADTYYDEYSQAWRVLGWYIDCDDCPQNEQDGEDNDANNNNNNGYRNSFCSGIDPNNPYLQMEYVANNNGNNNNDEDDRRRLEEAAEEEAAGDDAVADEAVYDYSNTARSQCSRVLLWAAYVDLDYDGNQGAEYQIFNRKTNLWDTSLCKGSASRCAKLNCHLPGSSFKLLGIFKDKRADNWMSQLFDKEGDCVWNDDEYSFMNYASRNNYLELPQGCTRSQKYVSELRGKTNGRPLYYDIKPAAYGRASVGIYTDSDCINEYKGEVTPETMMVSEGKYKVPLDSEGNATSTLETDLGKWNDAFDAFKICQPCKAYDLTRATVSHGFQRNYNNQRFGSASGTSACSASAEPNFNQCKLFVRGGYSRTASYAEVEMAGNQGTIAGIQVNGVTYGKTNLQMNLAPWEMTLAWIVLIGSLLLFVSGVISLMRARVAANRALSAALRQPLVPSEGVAA